MDLRNNAITAFFLSIGNYSGRGYILLSALVIASILFVISSGLITYTNQYARFEKMTVGQAQALHLAEAGIDKAVHELNQNSGYPGETLNLPGGTVVISTSAVDLTTRRVTATGYVPNNANPTATRTIKATAAIGNNNIAFHYGIQVGNGGFTMSGAGTTVNGSLYSNGSISLGSGTITGSAIAANLASAVADQINDTPATPTYNTTFGNANGTEDFAQSFTISQSYSFNNIQFYIKKVGAPSNATVRILYDNNGTPGSAIAGLTGTLNASLVTTSYGWVTVTMPTSPILSTGETYWLVIDGSNNASNYYIIGGNSNGYGSGGAKIGRHGSSWSATSPSDFDGYFKMYLGGQTSTISGGTIGTTGDDVAWAHTVNNTTISGPLYCQSGSSNNKACDTSRADPDPLGFPLSDGNIQDWKDEALAGGEIEDDLSVSENQSIGPTKIDGDVSITGGKTLTLLGTLWISGNLSLTGGSKIKLDESYGSLKGAIIVDGYITLAGNSTFEGSGQPDSYPFLITTSSCPNDTNCGGNNNAISFGGGSGTVSLVAQNGTISITGGSDLKAITAKHVDMSGGAVLYYDSGLVNSNFYSGPGGSYSIVNGTYVITQ